MIYNLFLVLLLGESLLVKPVTDPGANSVSVYFPGENVVRFSKISGLATVL